MVDDLGDRDRILPVLAGAWDMGHRVAADKAELAALIDHTAIAGWESTRVGPVGNDMADRKLALQALALGFEVDGAGEAFQFAASGF